MITSADDSYPSVAALLRGEPRTLARWIADPNAKKFVLCVVTILIGTGLYGAAMGCWRAPLQGLFVAIKFPLIILLTAAANAVLNGMLAPLLGLNIGLRQSFVAILFSFTILAAILGAFSPLIGFVLWNSPPMASGPRQQGTTYTVIQLTHVAVIAFAGVTANLRLLQLLRKLSGNVTVARRVLFAWLAGNLFFGSQLSWILRPFIGSPGLEVEFLRKTAFQGNFYETVFQSVVSLFNPH
jgi:hypothetical protein